MTIDRVPWNLRDVGLASAVVVAGLVVSVFVFGAVYVSRDGDPTTRDTLVVAAVLSGLMVAGAWVFGALKYHVGWTAFGLVPASGWRAYGVAALALITSLMFTGLYGAVVSAAGVEVLEPPEVPEVFLGEGLGLLGTVFVLGFVGPFAEEIFFRGFIYGALRNRFTPYGAIAISAAVFAVLHADLGVLLPIFGTGLALAWVYEKTGSLWPPLAAHTAQNLLALSVSV